MTNDPNAPIWCAEVYECEYGLVVRSPGLPISAMEAFAKMAGKGAQYMPGAGRLQGCHLFPKNKAAGKKWFAEMESAAAPIGGEHPARAFTRSPHYGISAATLIEAVFGIPSPHKHTFGHEVPHDPADLNRCLKAMEAIPGLREGLPKVVGLCPEWAPLVARWDEVEALFREEAPSGKCPKTYALMKELGC